MHLVELVANLHTNTWFSLSQEDKIIMTKRGSRQGCRFGVVEVCTSQVLATGHTSLGSTGERRRIFKASKAAAAAAESML